MSKPKIYDQHIATTNSAVQNGSGNSKASGKHKARYPHAPLSPSQKGGGGSVKHRAYTPDGPAGS
jgi:hypothetical protein